MRPRIPVRDRISAEPSHKDDPLGLMRDAINATYHKATVGGDDAVKRVALTMLAHLAKERRAAKIPEYRTTKPRVNA